MKTEVIASANHSASRRSNLPISEAKTAGEKRGKTRVSKFRSNAHRAAECKALKKCVHPEFVFHPITEHSNPMLIALDLTKIFNHFFLLSL